ncbi:phosphonate metabolism protein/1,5-bisphosphokinase (PRPP-forming) PhnN [Elioraea sp.]|uniref:phosphonate metabolism protein/1,5-bisphosphokinase (PRPP-forming) PhnN n=1 Tax=Elioraea sp. TaxID=2185103 RepID=UPI0025BFD476|nr:phosphonate metabolism protein/1,5-bisphosphokinase (PRPP-forming) PhnN [Elioraea sp.]
MTGTLVLVFGPSGAGKDSVIEAARAMLPDDAPVVFARRAITRPEGSGGEAHEAVSWAMFAARRAAGAFLLSWEANGNGYGIPRAVTGDLAAGRTVVASVSRTVLGEAARLGWPVLAVRVTAPAAVLAGRLAARGRESEGEISHRLARAGLAEPDLGLPVMEIVNGGALADAARRFADLLVDQPPKP